jgi:hypothetical protein
MRVESNRRRGGRAASTTLRYAFAASLLLGGMAPALAQTANPSEAKPGTAAVKMPDPVPGDTWSYEVKDEISGKLKAKRTDLLTDVTKNEINLRLQVADTERTVNIIYDRSWDIVRDGPLKYSPNDGTGIRLPLAVGAQWKFAADVTDVRYGQTFKRTGISRVVKQESITTKAGTFNTFVVETNFTGRNVQDPTLINQTTWVTWFDPDIDHWVKRTILLRQNGHVVGNDTVQLTEYGRKQQ